MDTAGHKGPGHKGPGHKDPGHKDPGHKDPGKKDSGALRTIGELSLELGVAQHILRYWETRFPQLRPMQRAGNRRYYRPADVDLVRKISRLLNQEGYTVRGVQKLLLARDGGGSVPVAEASVPAAASTPPASQSPAAEAPAGIDVFRLIALRNRLAALIES